MKYLVLDVETTTGNGGNPFDARNKLCVISYATADESGCRAIEYGDNPYSSALEFIQRLVDGADILVGFNFKFDLHWLRKYGIRFSSKRIWDCQLAAFYLDAQRNPLPSLDGCVRACGITAKTDKVAAYWDLGIDTPDIPWEVLRDYAINDAEITRDLFLYQYAASRDKGDRFFNLLALHNQDLLVTAEMEWNGLLLDVDACHAGSEQTKKELDACTKQLDSYFGVDGWVNYDSTKQLSALLFGGRIVKEWKEEVGIYKSGAKIGLPRYRWREEPYDFKGIVKPLKGTKLADGGYSTSGDHLRSIPARRADTRAILDCILKRGELEKLRSSYFEGLPKILSEMGWEGGYLHGQINHVTARTGRTSSSKPNMQNTPPEIDRLFRSRFGDDGFVVGFDAKGLEWVGIAYLSQDPVAIQEIKDGVDQHAMNQERFGLPEKRVAKFFVFRLIYGGQAYTFTVDPDFFWVSDKEEFWQNVMDKFYDKYAAIDKTHKDWYRNAIENGKFVSPTGREFIFTPKHGDWKWTRPVILNYPVQSLGVDLMAIARVSFKRRFDVLNLRSRLVNTVHDSIVLDIHKEEWYTIRTLMDEVFRDIPSNFEKLFKTEFNVPMRVEAKRLDGEEIIL